MLLRVPRDGFSSDSHVFAGEVRCGWLCPAWLRGEVVGQAAGRCRSCAVFLEPWCVRQSELPGAMGAYLQTSSLVCGYSIFSSEQLVARAERTPKAGTSVFSLQLGSPCVHVRGCSLSVSHSLCGHFGKLPTSLEKLFWRVPTW